MSGDDSIKAIAGSRNSRKMSPSLYVATSGILMALKY